MSLEKAYIFSLSDLSEADKVIIEDLQDKDAKCFRILYNNSGMTVQDINNLRSRFGFSARYMEYLIKEAEIKRKQWSSRKKTLTSRLNKQITRLSKEKKEAKKEEIKKKIIKLKRQIKHNIVFGGRKNLQMISKLKNKVNLTDKEKLSLETYLADYKRLRLGFIMFMGETKQKGSRFFDFSGLGDGEILFKLEATKIKIPLKFNINSEKRRKELRQLEYLALNNQAKIAVKFNTKEIQFTFDMEVLKQFKVISKKKANRYAGIDQNPDGIGLVIKDKGSDDYLFRCFYSTRHLLNKQISPNIRNNDWVDVIIDMFRLLEHYKVGNLVAEILDFDCKDLCNRVSNRKVNNSWNTALTEFQIRKRCSEKEIKLININPAYTSFVGNMKHDTFDPVAAATEIVDRGIMYNEMRIDLKELILTDYKTNKTLNGRLYGKFVSCTNWIDLYKLTKTDSSVRQRELKPYVKQVIDLGKHNRISCYVLF